MRKSGGIIIYVVYRSYRDVAQFGEHYVRDVGAAGSNPVIPTKNGKQIALLCGLFFLLPNVSRNNTESEVIKESVLNKYPPV